MPQVEVEGLTINYEVQGEGEPLLLIPYTSADHACYAYQLPSIPSISAASPSIFPARARATSPLDRTRPLVMPIRSRPS